MKRHWHASVFTLCLMTTGAIWIFLDVRLMPKQNPSSYFVHSTPQGKEQHTETPNSPPHTIQFKNILNNSVANPSQSEASQVSTSLTVTEVTPFETSTHHVSNKHIVAVVSYMRSGSTFTADILQHFPGTVYVFEPLHMLFARIRDGKPVYYLNGTRRFLTQDDLTDHFVYQELYKWFNCRYTELDVHSLADNFHAQFSRSMKKLVDCWRPKRHTLKSMRECVPGAIRMCENARHRLFKFIRLRMRLMEKALQQFPNLQIIHLIRDPRGSLTSEIILRGSDWNVVENKSIARCSALSADLNTTFTFLHNYPSRIRILIYERLAMDPLNMARRLFSFLGLPSYEYVLRYISKLTLEGRKDGKAFQIIRGNSTKTAFQWRQNVNFTDIQIIDSVCENVYTVLGYLPMSSPDDLINETVPTYVTTNLPGLL